MSHEIIAGILFITTFILIVTERADKTVSALAGGTLMIVFGVLDQEQAFEAIDFNVIFLLAGMMIITTILSKTGVFEWIAVKSVRLANGNPFRVLVILSTITALASAILDNVTTVVLIAPVTFFVASRLQVDPVPFLMAEILASNVGGTATLIGDPPNILVGSASHLGFIAFLVNLAPVSVIIFLVFLGTFKLLFAKQMKAHDDLASFLKGIEEEGIINDKPLLLKGIIVLLLTIVGFLFHSVLDLEPATVALAGAVTLMIVGRQSAHQVLREIEWPTLFFFIGLFMLVGGIVNTGIISALAREVLALTQGNLVLTSMLILWFSAILSGIVDNIPYTATMIPFIREMGSSMDLTPLWWSLALGACLGGNATIIGASANVIVVNLAARNGSPISFFGFMKYGLVITIESMLICSIYIWVRYL